MSKQNIKKIKRVEFIFVMVLGAPLTQIITYRGFIIQNLPKDKRQFKHIEATIIFTLPSYKVEFYDKKIKILDIK